jgi:hypothetical protein
MQIIKICHKIKVAQLKIYFLAIFKNLIIPLRVEQVSEANLRSE